MTEIFLSASKTRVLLRKITQEFIKIYVCTTTTMTASSFTIKTFHPAWYFIINRQRKERERERWQFTVIVLKSVSIILRVIRHARSISISRGRIRRKKRVSDTDCEKKKRNLSQSASETTDCSGTFTNVRLMPMHNDREVSPAHLVSCRSSTVDLTSAPFYECTKGGLSQAL